jgi:hypothetical protein
MSGTTKCMSVAPDGISLATNISLATLISVAPDITQTTDAGVAGALPGAFGLSISPTLVISDSSVNGTNFGGIVGFGVTAALKNSTDDNYGGGAITAFTGAANITKTSTGTATAATVDIFKSQITSPAASVTITTGSDFRALDLSGTVNGTVTRHWGFLAEAFTKGTGAFQFGAGKVSSITGTPPTGYGAWGVETGITTDEDRFTYKTATGKIWRLSGMATMVGGAWTTAGTALASDTTARWFHVHDTGVTPVITNDDSVDFAVPGDIRAFAMSCGLSSAPNNGANTQSRTFTLRDDNADTALSCTISETALGCTDFETSPVVLAAGSLISWGSTASNGGGSNPIATDVTCTLYYNVDGF